MIEEIVRIENLTKEFEIKRGPFKKSFKVRAVDSVSFSVFKGEIFGIVGESGSGKTTLGRIISGIAYPFKGLVRVFNTDVSKSFPKELRKEIQMVFQDPFSSLNPRMKVKDIIAEPLYIHTDLSRKEIEEKVDKILLKVGLSPLDKKKYPHEFSGGERQRISIARAVVSIPSLIILDEPTSSLDVFIQAQIVNLLLELKKEHDLTYIFISHNIPLVAKIADRIAVMQKGKVVEIGPSKDVYFKPSHPYTRALIESIPELYKTLQKTA